MAQELTPVLVNSDVESYLTVALALLLNHKVSVSSASDGERIAHELKCSCGIQVGIVDVDVLTTKHPLLEEALKIMAENHR